VSFALGPPKSMDRRLQQERSARLVLNAVAPWRCTLLKDEVDEVFVFFLATVRGHGGDGELQSAHQALPLLVSPSASQALPVLVSPSASQALPLLVSKALPLLTHHKLSLCSRPPLALLSTDHQDSTTEHLFRFCALKENTIYQNTGSCVQLGPSASPPFLL
jgi:hypothetical protein